MEADLVKLLDNAPTSPDSKVDKHGRPALGADCKARTVTW